MVKYLVLRNGVRFCHMTSLFDFVRKRKTYSHIICRFMHIASDGMSVDAEEGINRINMVKHQLFCVLAISALNCLIDFLVSDLVAINFLFDAKLLSVTLLDLRINHSQKFIHYFIFGCFSNQ